MKTMVYFASGPPRDEYQDLQFEAIYLIDNCFKNKRNYPDSVFQEGKVTCLGMDCLESINWLKRKEVKIDCFVCINEGLGEGGGSYPINSEFFMAYAMLLFNDELIHVYTPKIYFRMGIKAFRNIPYIREKIDISSQDYFDPSILTRYDGHIRYVEFFKLTQKTDIKILNFNKNIKISIYHDSIWNYYDDLELLILSIKNHGQGGFFYKIPKVKSILESDIKEVLKFCVENRVSKIGLTPWALGNYFEFRNIMESYQESFPSEISLFHLNYGDYKYLIK